MSLVRETDLPNLYYRGKVRDTYRLDGQLLMVATDRVSAFDSVLPAAIPDKGLVLNQISAFWFQRTQDLVPNHMVRLVDDADWLNAVYGERVCAGYYSFPSYLAGRSMVVSSAERIDVECVVRGYLSGSAWAEYRQTGTVSGMALAPGFRESEKLPEPLFTPTTKAATGHDEPITLDQMKEAIGHALAEEIVDKCLAIYARAEEHARSRGIIIADTKMEFGLIGGRLSLIDELLTPDSSRFWDAERYQPGGPQPSFDKQPLRDWLVASGWNKEPPAPELPPDVVEETAERYRQAFRRLTGHDLLRP